MSKINYRKLWEKFYGNIPFDENNVPYDIHHKDGNRANNDINNLQCVSLQEHYNIHYTQGDYGACNAIALRLQINPEEKKILCKIAGQKGADFNKTRIWYNNSIEEKMFVINQQPEGWVKGRLIGLKTTGMKRTPEQIENIKNNHWSKKQESPNKGKIFGKNGTMWITNGQNNLKIKVTDIIPDSYYKGRSKFRKIK